MDQITNDLQWLRLNARVEEEVDVSGCVASAQASDGAVTHHGEPLHAGAENQLSETVLVPSFLPSLEPSRVKDSHASVPPPPPCRAHSLDALFASTTAESALRAAHADALAAREAESAAQRDLQQVSAQLNDARTEAEQHRVACARLCRQVSLYGADLQVVEEQVEALGRTTQSVREEVRKAWAETDRLHAALDAAQAQLMAYDALKAAHAEAQVSLAALRAQQDEVVREHAELRGLVESGRQAVEEGAAFWNATREERAALQHALAVSEAANRDWETQFALMALRRAPPHVCWSEPEAVENRRDGATARVATIASAVEEEAQENSQGSGRAHHDDASVASEASLLAVLEAKVVDLAVSLQASTRRAAALEGPHDGAHTVALVQDSLLTSACAQLAVVRPVAAGLARQCTALRAACLAAESRHDALLATYQRLLEDYTADALHTHALELALAQQQFVRHHGTTAATAPQVVASVAMRRPRLSDLLAHDRKRPHV